MTEVVFQSAIDGTEAREELVSLKERTLVARFTENTGIFRLTPELVGEALLRVLPATDVVAMGCLRGNHEWHFTLVSCEAEAALVAAERITVRAPEGTKTAYFVLLMQGLQSACCGRQRGFRWRQSTSCWRLWRKSAASRGAVLGWTSRPSTTYNTRRGCGVCSPPGSRTESPCRYWARTSRYC